MNESKAMIGAAGRVAAIFLEAVIFRDLAAVRQFRSDSKGGEFVTSDEASPKQIQELMTLLADPKVRNWLEQQNKAQAAPAQAATEESASQALDDRLVPGEQFVIRRKAYAMIKKAFDENGIKFAFPTVQIAGEGESATAAAVAQRGLELTQAAAAE